MAKTDGYITDKPNGDWRYSNTAQGDRGDSPYDSQTDVESPAYLRVQRDPAGAIAGTKVDTEGAVSAGPVVAFNTLNSLLDGAAAEAGNKPWIVWAGVSPLSLSEAIIIWNQPIVLLNQTKITGGSGIIGVAGRTMIVQLNNPISIDGEETKIIKIQPGAVGQYRTDVTAVCTATDNTTVNTPSGDLTPLPDPATVCDCSSPNVGAGLGDQAGGQSANVLNALIFAEELCQTGGCTEVLVDPNLGFIVNNGMNVPVRCCHPFVLQQLWVNGIDPPEPACTCTTCPVWLACLYIFGATCPLEVFAVDQLLTIPDAKLCSFEQNFPSGRIPGTLQSDANCCAGCNIEIVGNSGPLVAIDGEWRGEIPGVAGQPAYLNYKDQTSCSNQKCQNVIQDDSPADTWTEEGIIKPKERVLPVAFFGSLGFKTTDVTVPNFTTGEPVTAITTCPTALIHNITDFGFTPINNITSLTPTPLTAFENAGTLSICAWTTCPTINPLSMLVFDDDGSYKLIGASHPVNVAACPTVGQLVSAVNYGTIMICSDGSMVSFGVVTSITLVDIPCTNITNIDSTQKVGTKTRRVFDLDSPDPSPVNVVTADTALPFTNFDIHTSPVNVITSLIGPYVNVVTTCEGNDISLPTRLTDIIIKGFSVNTTAPDISLLIPTTASCAAQYKFVMHDGQPLLWTSIIADFIVPCGPGDPGICDSSPQSRRFCSKAVIEMPNENHCTNVNLLNAIYTSKTETSDQSCMGYDCSPEGEPTPPKGTDVPNGPHGPVACGILIRRPRRRPFLKCT